MQANTNDRFLNMQIFAGLLRCVSKICIERLIGHLVIVDIEDVSQKWYHDFFRLAGFYRCCCQSSAGSTLELEARNCLASRQSPDRNFSIVYERLRTWLAEGRCTAALLDSVASGEAVEVERRYFHDLLAELGKERRSQSAQMRGEFIARDQTRSQRPWQKSVGRPVAPRSEALKPGTKTFSSRKHWCSQDTVVKSVGGPALGVREKRKRSQNTQQEGFRRTRKAHKLYRCSRQ